MKPPSHCRALDKIEENLGYRTLKECECFQLGDTTVIPATVPLLLSKCNTITLSHILS